MVKLGRLNDGYYMLAMVLWAKMVSLWCLSLVLNNMLSQKTSVSPLEWINCGSDSDKTSPDDSMNNSTEEEDQV